MKDTRTATRERLLHLADRTRRGVALPAEHDALHAGINALCDRVDKQARALDRGNALTDQWAGDMTPVPRSNAADLVATVLELNGWDQQPARPRLAVVPAITKESA
ncbi:hypothetical protein [Streptomyces sp900116325]|uniref:hypothetical protein n=1 Tax=Streptomyces sp. 900116325 TaxID=3154295 RepID=UPI00340D7293